MSHASAIIEYISELSITQGRRAGERFQILPWQRRFIRGAFSVSGDSALSIARANGKSTLIAGIAAAALDGPLAEPNAETVCVASSFEQGRIIFRHVLQFLDAKIESDKREWRVQDSANRANITHRPSGASVRCIGSDPRRAHGLAPRLVVADELAQWESGKIDGMLSALRTSLGKIPDSRLIAIGTRAASPEHPFSVMLSGGAAYSQVHAARESDPPFQRRTWRKANPSLDHLLDLEAAIRKEVRAAKSNDADMAAFKALRLNLGVPDVVESLLMDADRWRRIEGDVEPSGAPVLGIDLGTTAAMSAAAAYFPDTGRLEAFACFPEKPGLIERETADHVPMLYRRMAARDELIFAGEYVSDVKILLRTALERWGKPCAIVADRWREGDLKEALSAINFPFTNLSLRGQGFKDGAEDVRHFRAACLSGGKRGLS